MPGKDDPQQVIESYHKRQQFMPFLIGGLAVLLLVVGVIVLVAWLAGPNHPQIALGSTQTPTETVTVTHTPVTPSVTPSFTPTETITPTVTETVTPSGPFEYVVQADDNCFDLSVKFNVDLSTLLAINNLNGNCLIQPGQKILIPAPGQELPSSTPFPTGLASGTIIEHTVASGESVAYIASLYNSTADSIVALNKLTDVNTIFAGQVLKVKVNLVTPTKTLGPTSTGAAATLQTTIQPSVTQTP
jgi:LysM repeat protein